MAKADASRLAIRLNSELSLLGSSLRVADPLGSAYAHVGLAGNTCQIMENPHGFHIDCWRKGTLLLTVSASDLRSAALALDGWCCRQWTTATMAGNVSGTSISECAEAFESGREVRWKWEKMIRNESWPGLGEFVQVAWQHPVLGQLFPFTSLYWFCLSRCTGWPYDLAGIPVVRKISTGLFEVRDRMEGTILGKGVAGEAVGLVAAGVPEHIRAAVPGTAEQFESKGAS